MSWCRLDTVKGKHEYRTTCPSPRLEFQDFQSKTIKKKTWRFAQIKPRTHSNHLDILFSHEEFAPYARPLGDPHPMPSPLIAGSPILVASPLGSTPRKVVGVVLHATVTSGTPVKGKAKARSHWALPPQLQVSRHNHQCHEQFSHPQVFSKRGSDL